MKKQMTVCANYYCVQKGEYKCDGCSGVFCEHCVHVCGESNCHNHMCKECKPKKCVDCKKWVCVKCEVVCEWIPNFSKKKCLKVTHKNCQTFKDFDSNGDVFAVCMDCENERDHGRKSGNDSDSD